MPQLLPHSPIVPEMQMMGVLYEVKHKNLFTRLCLGGPCHKFECQYCGAEGELTFDHVIPRSKGGITSWTNVCAACSPCNLSKANKLPKDAKMFPRQKPYMPTIENLHRNGRKFPPNHLHESWMDFLYWDTELEP